ncbi:MAG: hypothetical protein KGI73_00200 [Patescibacteria group bacterium]|nr:hypothetical protein [Patescibacteria group bacterium]
MAGTKILHHMKIRREILHLPEKPKEPEPKPFELSIPKEMRDELQGAIERVMFRNAPPGMELIDLPTPPPPPPPPLPPPKPLVQEVVFYTRYKNDPLAPWFRMHRSDIARQNRKRRAAN